MKKSRIFSALLVLALLSTCVIGGTFAKYTTSGTATDTARVAKFGVTVSDSATLFAEEYDTDDSSVAATITKSVVSTNKVLAPGTSGSLTESSISGTTEVAVNVSRTATVTLTGWEVDSTYYCPIVITVGGTSLCGLDYENAAAFKSAVEAKVAESSTNYPANDTLSGDSLSISWKWEFSNRTGSEDNQSDEKDTKLGKATMPATIEITVVTTVTQID